MTAERDLRDAVKKGSTEMSPPKFEDRREADRREDDRMRLPSVTIDFRVPLWQIVASGGFFVSSLIGMYYQLAELSRNVIELQATVKANNAQVIEFAREQGIMKYRLEKLEASERK